MSEPFDDLNRNGPRADDGPHERSARPLDQDARPPLGMMLLVLGGLICLLATADGLHGLPWRMPRSWYQFQTIWLCVGVVSLIAGVLMQRPPQGDETDTR